MRRSAIACFLGICAVMSCNRGDRAGAGEQNRPAAQTSAAPRPADTTAGTSPSAKLAEKASPREAEGEFKTVKGVKLQGDTDLVEVESGVRVSVNVRNAPKGPKGIHIHEKGDCSNIAGGSMGKHFAPDVQTHGFPDKPPHHLGDLGNIEIADDGKGSLDLTILGANLKPGDRMSFLGKAMVIHQGMDKGEQPAGGAGSPMACAVIEPD